MARSNEADGQRRRVPEAMALDAPARTGYRGKIIKKTIERNRISTIKRKYFKELKKDAQSNGQLPEQSQQPFRATKRDNSSNGDKHEMQGVDTEHKDMAGTSKLGDRHKQRSNPFQKVMRKREDIKKEKDEQQRQREMEIRQAEIRRKKSAHRRKNEHNLHTARTSRGQPVLASQIYSLLNKIKKNE
ncbi:hypothetical protein GGH19_000655 [Coemansia sp. RSA 1807]|nr:hypothetical protein GGF48_000389 [Coemansia sp. RSA 921]KAJ2281810.1 hypothetical protein EV176_000237 [Coemansia sp. RSA 451]KAJ2533932.1 hypothetical protein GGH20_000337 [Coemansia sp. RSA 1937]KAJ2578251.1 hypothetical protein GGH19_000655 [Coemansia sp. RSA 1807]KAJ2586715.1 hypothetical protein IWW49_003866 [Coemansia sp. RSA 1797]